MFLPSRVMPWVANARRTHSYVIAQAKEVDMSHVELAMRAIEASLSVKDRVTEAEGQTLPYCAQSGCEASRRASVV
eukprot:1728573-Amphidinium_carterae.1